MTSPEYQHYLLEWNHIVETGVGFGFKIFTAGLAWYPLEKSNKVNDYPAFGNIYGDLIFHLGESVWRPDFGGGSHRSQRTGRPSLAFFLRKASDALKPILPAQVKQLFGPRVQTQIVTPMYEYVRQQLLDDPEGYLNYLRTGEVRMVR
jgi:hypothetical protein